VQRTGGSDVLQSNRRQGGIDVVHGQTRRFAHAVQQQLGQRPERLGHSITLGLR
jgi:hypothetical protein